MPEKKILLNKIDEIDPGDINSCKGGFKALEKAVGMSPEEVIQEIKDSGLRGRGGAGFPCGVKWEMARNAKGDDKILICNADEGEVGTFKDRYLLSRNPFLLLEGMAIAAYAIGAGKGYIYLRAEYRNSCKRGLKTPSCRPKKRVTSKTWTWRFRWAPAPTSAVKNRRS